MIKVFRKIRQKLLGVNQVGRYLLYAVGEIILVVIGILIALQANTWKEDRKDFLKSIDYQERLLEDVNHIIVNSEKYLKRSTTILKSISETVKILEKGRIENREEESTFNEAIVQFPRFTHPFPDLSTYEEMKSSGDLHLIINKDLLKTINDFESNLEASKEVFEKHARSVQSNMNIYSKYIKFSVDPQTFATSASSDFQKMVLDKEYINAFALLEINWRANCVFNRDLMKDGKHLKEMLETELSRLSQQ